jgi:hypothetical protein
MKIEGLKPWHIVLFVVAVGGLAAGVYFSVGSDRPQLRHSVLMADVVTGELFRVDTSKGIFIPAVNPDTGKPSLFPAEKGEDGSWRVKTRYLNDDAIKDLGGSPAALLDVKSGALKLKSDSVRTLD